MLTIAGSLISMGWSMIAKLTPNQFEALAQLTRMTTESQSYMVAYLVLVAGDSISHAAESIGTSYKNAHAAVTRALVSYNLARKAAGLLPL